MHLLIRITTNTPNHCVGSGAVCGLRVWACVGEKHVTRRTMSNDLVLPCNYCHLHMRTHAHLHTGIPPLSVSVEPYLHCWNYVTPGTEVVETAGLLQSLSLMEEIRPTGRTENTLVPTWDCKWQLLKTKQTKRKRHCPNSGQETSSLSLLLPFQSETIHS